MASIACSVAAPITVPRAVVRLSMAFVSADLSVVGGTTSCAKLAKAMMPIRVPATWCGTKSFAAFCAAVSRFGATSVAHIEPETSRVRMIDVRLSGTSSEICGRDVAKARAAMAARNRPTGTWRRQCGRAAATPGG